MAYGEMTEIATGGVATFLNIVKSTGGMEESCYGLILQNNGSETLYFNYNRDNDVTLSTGIELMPGGMFLIQGTDGEQIRKISHMTSGLASTFKWTKVE